MTDTLWDGRPTMCLATWDEADALLTAAKNDGTIEFERRAINHSAQAAKRDRSEQHRDDVLRQASYRFVHKCGESRLLDTNECSEILLAFIGRILLNNCPQSYQAR